MNLKKCHFIGIGGIGMSGLARLALSQDIAVSGSDIASSSVTDMLKQSGAKIYQGHSAGNISSDMTVIYSTDIKKDNPEYQAALQYKCPLMHRSELLQKLMESYRALTVAGTHGKTTTSALLAWVLESSGNSPSYAVGGIVPQLSSNAGHGKGKYFVAEACESDGTFLNYKPYGSIVTNIDFDHMDHYVTEQALIDAFKQFIGQVKSTEHLFWCGDDSRLRQLSPPGISYGFGSHCILKASNFQQHGWTMHFDVEFKGKTYPQLEVALTGKHNALNALAVFGLALSLGLSEKAIREALRTFKGVMRRCEKKGETHGILFLDDYGHHPTELKATLKAIRQAVGERRMVVVYQPHRYSRAKECMGCYSQVFEEADQLFVTEIYAAREEPIPGVTHEKIIAEIQQERKSRCRYLPRDQAASTLAAYLRPHDVLVTLGAGDVTKISGEVLSELALKKATKLKVGVICGGASVEHEVSLSSVEYVLAFLRSDLYEVELFGISRKGVWLAGTDIKKRLAEDHGDSTKISSDVLDKLMKCDILFPMLHGTNGEDGTVQGFFELLSKPYVGCDCRSGAISMDKVITKKLALQAGIPTAPFVSFNRHEWSHQQEEILKEIHASLRYPLYAKPIHLGSSIGVHRAVNEKELLAAITDAFRFDTHVLVENGIDGREIEFSVIGNDSVTVFPAGEVFAQGAFYHYDAKYGANSTKTTPRADLPEDLMQKGMDLVKKTYQAVACVGMARIDTFLDKEGKFWLNEVNPIPGMTKTSLFPQMCTFSGLGGQELMDRLIVLGLSRRRQLDHLELKP